MKTNNVSLIGIENGKPAESAGFIGIMSAATFKSIFRSGFF